MTVTSRENWAFGAQIITAAGMFLVTPGILLKHKPYLIGK